MPSPVLGSGHIKMKTSREFPATGFLFYSQEVVKWCAQWIFPRGASWVGAESCMTLSFPDGDEFKGYSRQKELNFGRQVYKKQPEAFGNCQIMWGSRGKGNWTGKHSSLLEGPDVLTEGSSFSAKGFELPS